MDNTALFRWVKASERKPLALRLNVKYKGNADVIYCFQNEWAFDNSDGMRVFEEDWEHIEWLEEYITEESDNLFYSAIRFGWDNSQRSIIEMPDLSEKWIKTNVPKASSPHSVKDVEGKTQVVTGEEFLKQNSSQQWESNSFKIEKKDLIYLMEAYANQFK